MTEQLAKPMPTLDNVIIGENAVPQPAPQPVRSRKVTKAPNPLSQRKKKDIQTGRPSKKQLLAEQEREAEKGKRRAEKRPRDAEDSENGSEEDKPVPSKRPESKKADNDVVNDQPSTEKALPTTDVDVDAEQKKKRRKRRKKASGAAETTAADSDVEEN